MSFHNTIDIAGQTLKQAQKRVNKQETTILNWFLQHPHSIPTPWQLQEELKGLGHDMLITSVRRALSNLTDAGKLVKSSIQLKGPQGMSNHTWRLNITAKPKRTPSKKSNKGKSVPSIVSPQNLFDICRNK